MEWNQHSRFRSSDTSNALGTPDGVFLSLGMGGAAAFDFGTSFDATAIIFEITWGARAGYPEYANVYVGNTFSLNFRLHCSRND